MYRELGVHLTSSTRFGQGAASRETPFFDTKPNRDSYPDTDSNRLSARSISRRVASTIARELAIEVHDEEIVERLHKVS